MVQLVDGGCLRRLACSLGGHLGRNAESDGQGEYLGT